jgi:hypothetical protein
MADLLKIDVNVPVQVALTRKGPGRAVESKFGGEQRMYTLSTATGERVLYAKIELAEQIDKLALRAGEPFVIQKRVFTEGQVTVTRWLADLPQAQPGPKAAPSRQAAAPPARPNGAAVRQMPTPSVAEEVASGFHPAAQGVLSALMSLCITAAFDAWQVGQAHAAAKGHVLQFDAENVQGSASTMFINLCKQGQVMLPRNAVQQQGGTQWPN